MSRKDFLAAGARSAKFAGGMGDGDIFRNVSNEPREEFVPDTTATPVAKKVFRPLGDGLLVRQNEVLTPSGLALTETMEKEKPSEGTVLAIGKDVTTVSVGDTVVFGKYSGQAFKLNGEELLIMELKEVKGVISDVPTIESLSDKVIPTGGDIRELNVGGCIVGRA